MSNVLYNMCHWNSMCGWDFDRVCVNRRPVLQIAYVPNYTALMKACTPGGPTENCLGTSPVPHKGGKGVMSHTG